MTYQEAIKRIKIHNEHHSQQERFAIYITEALNMAIEALEKQIPKKPVTEKDKVIFGIVCGRCPECDNAVYSTTNLYCHKCGQALDWSDTE